MSYRSYTPSRSHRSNSINKAQKHQQYHLHNHGSNFKYKYLNSKQNNFDLIDQEQFNRQSSKEIETSYTQFAKYNSVCSSRLSSNTNQYNCKGLVSRHKNDYGLIKKLQIPRDHRYRNANYLKQIFQDRQKKQEIDNLSSSRYEKENVYSDNLPGNHRQFEFRQSKGRNLFEQFQHLQKSRVKQTQRKQENESYLKKHRIMKCEPQTIHQRNISALRQITNRYTNSQPAKQQSQQLYKKKVNQQICMSQRSHRRIIQIRQIIREQYSDQQ